MKEMEVDGFKFRVHDAGLVEVESKKKGDHKKASPVVAALAQEVLDLRGIRDRFGLRAFNAENTIERFLKAADCTEVPASAITVDETTYARYLGLYTMVECGRARWKVEGRSIEWI